METEASSILWSIVIPFLAGFVLAAILLTETIDEE